MMTQAVTLFADGHDDFIVDTPVDSVEPLSLMLAFVLPVLVGLVTTRVTHSGAKAILLLFLSAVTAFLTEWQNSPDNNFEFDQALLTWVVTFIIAVAAHFGLWKPTGVSAAAQNTLVKAKEE